METFTSCKIFPKCLKKLERWRNFEEFFLGEEGGGGTDTSKFMVGNNHMSTYAFTMGISWRKNWTEYDFNGF